MKLPELTFEEFGRIKLRYTYGLSLDTGAFRQYCDDKTGVCRETYTARNPDTGAWSKSKVWYYMKRDKRVFDTPDQLYVAYMEKACGIKP